MGYILLIAAAAALPLLVLFLRQRQWRARELAMRRLLDGADALEAQLLACRSRMQQLKSMLAVLPEEMSADANVALTADDKVQAALRDLLAHRLWIKQHAAEAKPAELDAACAAIEQSRTLMQAQLARLDAIAAELAAAQSSARTVTPRGKTSAS
ncbi:MAG TPA: hypothetical protein VFL07_00140 [Rudaea sp.]|nr:hypothetical protein [Rudaea sp.]